MTRIARWIRMAASIFVLVTSFIFLTAISNAGLTAQAANSTADKHQRSLSSFLDGLKSADNQHEASLIEDDIWKLWLKAPDEQTQALLDRALERRRWYDFAGAKLLLDEVIDRHPDYAEGWNQRAFILFLQEKFDQSLSDLEMALELEPRHFGALAGQARILMRQGRFAIGQNILKRAVKLHPFLRERSMIVKTQEQEL